MSEPDDPHRQNEDARHVVNHLTALLPAALTSGILQQFAISEATLLAWSSMDGESPRSGSNQGSVAHLSEVNQESITSRGKHDDT